MTNSAPTAETLVFVINETPEIEFQRSVALSQAQLNDLDALDKKMDKGIELGSDTISAPNQRDRATYIANQLVNAYTQGQESIAALCLTYLGQRLPQLLQIKAEIHSDRVSIQLIFDREYAPAKKVQFIRKEQLLKH